MEAQASSGPGYALRSQDSLGVRYGPQRFYVPLNMHKTLVQNPNPEQFLMVPGSGQLNLLVKSWSCEWRYGAPIRVGLPKTVRFTGGEPDWSSQPLPVAPIVTMCTCGQTPCLERSPLYLSDPDNIVVYDWHRIKRMAESQGRELVAFLPTVFAIINCTQCFP